MEGEFLYAFDLAMGTTGIAIFNMKTLQPVLVSSIKTKSNKTHGERLFDIKMFILSHMKKYKPKAIAIERGFTKGNTATQVSFRVHGVVNELFHYLPQSYYPPTSVKACIVSGNSSKKEVADALLEVYPHIEFKNQDESDAFAVGITYFVKNKHMDFKKILKEKRTSKEK